MLRPTHGRGWVDGQHLAEAHDFILRQPKRYDTMVGERGTVLSGGQRQRLAIARALLRDPRILILDEATSVLDGLTEEKVVRAMKAASVGRTTFVVAHRLATIRDADRILFFQDGVVAESGTFEELVARDGAFAALARTQFPALVEVPKREEMPVHEDRKLDRSRPQLSRFRLAAQRIRGRGSAAFLAQGLAAHPRSVGQAANLCLVYSRPEKENPQAKRSKSVNAT